LLVDLSFIQGGIGAKVTNASLLHAVSNEAGLCGLLHKTLNGNENAPAAYFKKRCRIPLQFIEKLNAWYCKEMISVKRLIQTILQKSKDAERCEPVKLVE